LSRVGCVGKVAAEQSHDERLQGKNVDEGAPEFAAQSDAGCGIRHSEYTGEQDTNGEAQRGLAAEIISTILSEQQCQWPRFLRRSACAMAGDRS
jgi:hypothetical protein